MLKTLCIAVSRGMVVIIAICTPYGAFFVLESLMERFPDFFATQTGGSVVFLAILVIMFVVTPASMLFPIALVVRNDGNEFGSMGP